MSKKLLAVIIALLSFSSCNKDEKDNTLVASIEVITLKSVVTPSGGVRLQGSYHSEKEQVSEIGFVYSKDNKMKEGNTYIRLKPNEQNNIDYFLGTGITNVKYYFQAYIKAGGVFYYGSVQSFTPNGSRSPVIDSISKLNGIIDDTISIYGKYLYDITNETSVLFSNTRTDIIDINDTCIRCTVPLYIRTIVSTIKVKIDNRIGSYSSFTLLAPIVESFSPLQATFRDEIVIKGKYFDGSTYSYYKNKVFIGNTEAQVTYADRNTLKVIVPDSLKNSVAPIRVIAQLQEAVSNENFNLAPPHISYIPNVISAGQVIEIKGENFHPIKENNKVTFENIKAKIISGNTKSLTVQVPLGPFPRRKAALRIQIADIITEHKDDLEIKDKWVLIYKNLPFNYYRGINNAVVVNNHAYIISKSSDYNDNKFYIWKLNTTDFTWERMDLPFTTNLYGNATSDGKKIYVYTATADNNFWEFDPLTNHWEQKKSFPSKRRDGSTHFSLNGFIYVGLGNERIDWQTVIYTDFYKYSPTSDTWTRMADFTHEPFLSRHTPSTFTINNIAYFGHGSSYLDNKTFWSYHPTTDEWKQIADCPVAARFTTGFELGGYGYVTRELGVNALTWRYDPALDKWEQSHSIIKQRSGHFSFTINGKAYIGGGVDDTYEYPIYDELWEFIP